MRRFVVIAALVLIVVLTGCQADTVDILPDENNEARDQVLPYFVLGIESLGVNQATQEVIIEYETWNLNPDADPDQVDIYFAVKTRQGIPIPGAEIVVQDTTVSEDYENADTTTIRLQPPVDQSLCDETVTIVGRINPAPDELHDDTQVSDLNHVPESQTNTENLAYNIEHGQTLLKTITLTCNENNDEPQNNPGDQDDQTDDETDTGGTGGSDDAANEIGYIAHYDYAWGQPGSPAPVKALFTDNGFHNIKYERNLGKQLGDKMYVPAFLPSEAPPNTREITRWGLKVYDLQGNQLEEGNACRYDCTTTTCRINEPAAPDCGSIRGTIDKGLCNQIPTDVLCASGTPSTVTITNANDAGTRGYCRWSCSQNGFESQCRQAWREGAPRDCDGKQCHTIPQPGFEYGVCTNNAVPVNQCLSATSAELCQRGEAGETNRDLVYALPDHAHLYAWTVTPEATFAHMVDQPDGNNQGFPEPKLCHGDLETDTWTCGIGVSAGLAYDGEHVWNLNRANTGLRLTKNDASPNGLQSLQTYQNDEYTVTRTKITGYPGTASSESKIYAVNGELFAYLNHPDYSGKERLHKITPQESGEILVEVINTDNEILGFTSERMAPVDLRSFATQCTTNTDCGAGTCTEGICTWNNIEDAVTPTVSGPTTVQGKVGEEVTLSLRATGPADLKYRVNWSGEIAELDSLQSLSDTFEKPGVYTVTVTPGEPRMYRGTIYAYDYPAEPTHTTEIIITENDATPTTIENWDFLPFEHLTRLALQTEFTLGATSSSVETGGSIADWVARHTYFRSSRYPRVQSAYYEDLWDKIAPPGGDISGTLIELKDAEGNTIPNPEDYELQPGTYEVTVRMDLFDGRFSSTHTEKVSVFDEDEGIPLNTKQKILDAFGRPKIPELEYFRANIRGPEGGEVDRINFHLSDSVNGEEVQGTLTNHEGEEKSTIIQVPQVSTMNFEFDSDFLTPGEPFTFTVSHDEYEDTETFRLNQYDHPISENVDRPGEEGARDRGIIFDSADNPGQHNDFDFDVRPESQLLDKGQTAFIDITEENPEDADRNFEYAIDWDYADQETNTRTPENQDVHYTLNGDTTRQHTYTEQGVKTVRITIKKGDRVQHRFTEFFITPYGAETDDSGRVGDFSWENKVLYEDLSGGKYWHDLRDEDKLNLVHKLTFNNEYAQPVDITAEHHIIPSVFNWSVSPVHLTHEWCDRFPRYCSERLGYEYHFQENMRKKLTGWENTVTVPAQSQYDLEKKIPIGKRGQSGIQHTYDEICDERNILFTELEWTVDGETHNRLINTPGLHLADETTGHRGLNTCFKSQHHGYGLTSGNNMDFAGDTAIFNFKFNKNDEETQYTITWRRGSPSDTVISETTGTVEAEQMQIRDIDVPDGKICTQMELDFEDPMMQDYYWTGSAYWDGNC